MDGHNYSIQQVKLDVDFFSKEKAYELQNKLSRLYHQQIHGTLQDFFHKTLPEDLLIRKDSLIVHLGSMRYEQLESELPRRLQQALEELFAPLLSTGSTALQWSGQGFESLSPEAGEQALLEFYLVNGTFPWQAAVRHGLTWKVILSGLYQRNRNHIGILLQRLGRQVEVRKRLAFQSAEEDMEKVIIAIIPVEAPVILSYKKKITEVQQDKQLIKTGAGDFASAVSFFILTYLLEEQGSLFSQKMFIKSVLSQMAAHYNVSYLSVLAVLHESLIVTRHQAGTTHALFNLISELGSEHDMVINFSTTAAEAMGFETWGAEHAGSASAEPGAKNTARQVLLLSEKIVLLQYYLAKGTLPAWSASSGLGKEELASHLKEGIATAPSTVREMIFSLATDATASGAAIERISELLPVYGFTAFTRFLWPAETGFIEEYLLLLIQSNDKGLLGAGHTGAFETLLQKMVMKYLSKAGSSNLDKIDFIRFSLHYLSAQSSTAIPSVLEILLVAAGKPDKPGLKTHLQILKELREKDFTGAVYTAAVTRDEIVRPYKLHVSGALTGQNEITGSYKMSDPGTLTGRNEIATLQEIRGLASDQGTLSDVLNYFLQYGMMPWWSKEYSRFSPETLLRNLYRLSAQDALRILKRAGMQHGSKQRFLWQFSEDLVYEIFGILRDWNLAVIAIEVSIELIEALPALPGFTQLSIKHIIFGAVWSSYTEQEYNGFNEDHFYLSIFDSLSRYAASGTFEIAVITRIFKKAISNETIKSRSLANQLSGEESIMILSDSNEVLAYKNAAAGDENQLYTGDDQFKEKAGINTRIIFGNLDALLLKQTDKKAPLATAHRQQEVISLLEYYLTWNRLPDNLPALSRQELDNRLTEMLLLLYHEDRGALKRLMVSEKHSAGARMHIHKLFLPDYKGGDHKQLSLLLDEYIEKDALQYIKEISGTGNIATDKELKPALDRLLEKAKNGEAGEQLSLLLKSAPLTKYIASHYGEETMQWLIEKRSGSSQVFRQQSEAMRSLFLDLISDIFEKQRLRLLLNEATLFYLYGMGQPKNISGYIKAVFRYLAGSPYTAPRLFSILLNKIETDTYLASAHKEVIAAVRYELTYQLQIQDRELSIKRKMEAEELKTREAEAKALEQKIAAEQLSRQQKEQAQKKVHRILEKGNKFYVNNAGLILLHPFISTYFTRLELMEKGQFITTEAQARAVHLLQYLAFTSTSNPEHELMLNKILCNYPLHESLPLEFVISEQEAALSSELLTVVIERSGKLSKSSVEGFRASFLQRDGIITETEKEWTMRVEQRGYDLILPSLPWSFGMIKFQWMDKPMIIEWI